MKKIFFPILVITALLLLMACPGMVGVGPTEPTGSALMTQFSLSDGKESASKAVTGTDIIVGFHAKKVDIQNLVATFATAAGASVKIKGIDQVRGKTVNDFSSPVTYDVTAKVGEK